MRLIIIATCPNIFYTKINIRGRLIFELSKIKLYIKQVTTIPSGLFEGITFISVVLSIMANKKNNIKRLSKKKITSFLALRRSKTMS